MKKMDTQLKQTLEEIGKQAFPDDQDAWVKIQQRMERKGTPNIMTNRKEQQRSKTLKLAFGLGSAVIIAIIILISLPGNQALAKTLRSLFLPDSSDSEMLTETASIHLIHTVEEGDTLSVIAQGYGVSEDEIIAANPGIDPNFLWVGQQLFIPAVENCSDSWETILYTVEEGDILFVIASKFGVTEEEIIAANPGFDPNLLVVGKQLVIPDVIQCSTIKETMATGEWVAETEFGTLRFSIDNYMPGRSRISKILYLVSDWTCGDINIDDYGVVVAVHHRFDDQYQFTAETPWRDWPLSVLLTGSYDPEDQTFSGKWNIYISGTNTSCSGEWDAKLQDWNQGMAKGTWVAETEFGEISFVNISSNPERARFGQIRYAFAEGWTCGELTLKKDSSVVDTSGWVIGPNDKLKVTSKLPKVFWLTTITEYNYHGTWDESLWTITLVGAYDPITQTFTGTWEELIGETVCSGEWEAFLQE